MFSFFMSGPRLKPRGPYQVPWTTLRRPYECCLSYPRLHHISTYVCIFLTCNPCTLPQITPGFWTPPESGIWSPQIGPLAHLGRHRLEPRAAVQGQGNETGTGTYWDWMARGRQIGTGKTVISRRRAISYLQLPVLTRTSVRAHDTFLFRKDRLWYADMKLQTDRPCRDDSPWGCTYWSCRGCSIQAAICG
ncbi:uncharacterized protein B0T23DRAFT_389236 [Neurospora hispaniola]|uniref:Uncharacterized protein n=1 Tax=Neurospora hispaniola TaxID=588809 RepID=A0AAJ0I053_9PEZI|nr:hypothetical protein B0T23DRAFT_389236 [Neurospora hispaniola]